MVFYVNSSVLAFAGWKGRRGARREVARPAAERASFFRDGTSDVEETCPKGSQGGANPKSFPTKLMKERMMSPASEEEGRERGWSVKPFLDGGSSPFWAVHYMVESNHQWLVFNIVRHVNQSVLTRQVQCQWWDRQPAAV